MGEPTVRSPHAPQFEREVIADDLTDGYWIQAIDLFGSGRPGLLTSGLADGIVYWYENPGWARHEVTKLRQPVAFDAADVDGDGLPDLVVCHDYGESMYAHKPGDGRISWLRNPGAADGHWEQRRIGGLISAHRLRFGQYTTQDGLQLLALPVVGHHTGREAVHKPVSVTLYDRPADVLAADEWPARVVDDFSFTILHDLTTSADREGRSPNLVVASEEGLSEFGYSHTHGCWQVRRLGEGEPSQQSVTGFRGSSSVATGALASSGLRFAATLEPFHGNTVAVYVAGEASGDWSRTVLDVYGDPNEAGEGPGHHVVTADFDGDGDDEFLVALRGPMPWQGVFYYKAIDARAGLWVKRRVSADSAARIAVADFTGDGRLDFATIAYCTPGYFIADEPVVAVYHNLGGQL